MYVALMSCKTPAKKRGGLSGCAFIPKTMTVCNLGSIPENGKVRVIRGAKTSPRIVFSVMAMQVWLVRSNGRTVGVND